MANKKLYVGNISYDLDNNKLKETFESYGEVVSAQIITDRDTGRSKGFGFVEMSDAGQAQAAIDALNETEVGGRTLTVNEARPQTDRKNNRNDRNDGGRGFGNRRGRY